MSAFPLVVCSNSPVDERRAPMVDLVLWWVLEYLQKAFGFCSRSVTRLSSKSCLRFLVRALSLFLLTLNLARSRGSLERMYLSHSLFFSFFSWKAWLFRYMFFLALVLHPVGMQALTAADKVSWKNFYPASISRVVKQCQFTEASILLSFTQFALWNFSLSMLGGAWQG